MNTKLALSHVALLLPSVRKAADFLRPMGYEIGPEEYWDGEGTKEIYVGYGNANALLLIEPTKAGPYQRAMEKRGPGLHHLAIDVLNVENFLAEIPQGTWCLHEHSTHTLPKTKTAWLFYRGFPALIEVQERKELQKAPLLVENISLPIQGAPLQNLLPQIGMESILTFSRPEWSLRLAGRHEVLFKDLI